MTEEPRAIVSINYHAYVMSVEEAVAVSTILTRSECHESKYYTDRSTVDHIWSREPGVKMTITIMSRTSYLMAKAAGKPE